MELQGPAPSGPDVQRRRLANFFPFRSKTGEVIGLVGPRGIRIAIDDFGTGYSSLAYLRRFPVDRIKLAQEFIVDLVAGSSDAMIVRASIGLARTLGITVIAEGVETEQQLALLRSRGCEAAQGYDLARPMDADQIARISRRGRIEIGSPADHAIAA